MREILFRGKRIDNGEWAYGSVVVCNGEDGTAPTLAEIYEKGMGEALLVDPATVGQFTGVLDKNGTKIFEGDIMPLYEDGEKFNWKVIFNGGVFCLSFLNDEQFHKHIEGRYYLREVIGNIHDNPELLEAVQ